MNVGGQGWLITTLQVTSARDIEDFSRYPGEAEVLIIPNFCATVASEVLVDQYGGEYITLVENAGVFVF